MKATVGVLTTQDSDILVFNYILSLCLMNTSALTYTFSKDGRCFC